MLDRVPAYVDCPDCGTSISFERLPLHGCDARHRDDYADRVAAAAVDELEADLRAFFDTPQGRFERFYAQRTRRYLP